MTSRGKMIRLIYLKYLRPRRIKACLFTWVVLIFATLTPVHGWAEEIGYDYNYGLGKFNIRSQSPAQSLRLTLPLLIPGDIKPGWETQLGLTWSNVWASGPEYLLDYEMLDTVVTLAYGFNTRFGLALQFENRHYFGGAMDGLIEGFHDLFGIDQNGRDQVPKNGNVIKRFDPKTGQLLSEMPADELDNNGIDLLLNYNLTHGTKIWPSVNMFGVIRYGLTCPKICLNDHPLDFGFGFGFAKRWSKRWLTYVSLGYTMYESRETTAAPGVKPIEYENNAYTGLFSLAWNYTPTVAIIAQYLYSQAVIKNIQGVDEASHEVQMGFKWKTKYGLMEFAFTENIITMGNSPDFGLHGGWTYEF